MLKAIGSHAIVQLIEKDTTILRGLEFVESEDKANIGRIISIGDGWKDRIDDNTPGKIDDIILFNYYNIDEAFKLNEKTFCFVAFHAILAIVDSSVVF